MLTSAKTLFLPVVGEAQALGKLSEFLVRRHAEMLMFQGRLRMIFPVHGMRHFRRLGSFSGIEALLVERVVKNATCGSTAGRSAVINEEGSSISYRDLLRRATSVALPPSQCAFIGILCKDPIQMGIGILAAWLNGGVAVPLHYSYPLDELRHRLQVAGCERVLCDSYYADLEQLGVGTIRLDRAGETNALPVKTARTPDSPALVLFTSGTTGKPKGALHTFGSLAAQLSDLNSIWELGAEDRILHSLPLNHIHGLVTGLFAAWWNGGSSEIHGTFDAERLARSLESPTVSMFTAVPTVYSKLTPHLRNKPRALEHLRLLVSGSSALSKSLFEEWRDFRCGKAGIVERYGMTETGMIASNPIAPHQQVAESVGKAFPSIQIRIAKDSETDRFGKVLVKGPGLFAGYLSSKESSLDGEGYFETGDQGYLDGSSGLFLVGRNRDIFKVGGYKVSAAEVEAALQSHVFVKECAVVALNGAGAYGDLVAAVVITDTAMCSPAGLRGHLEPLLAHYKIPRRWVIRKDGQLPRNMLGKVDKGAIVNQLQKEFARPGPS